MDRGASRRRMTCCNRRPARRDRGSGRGTTAHRPRPSATSARSIAGRSAPSSPSCSSRGSRIRVQKSLSRERLQGRSLRLPPHMSPDLPKKQHHHRILPPAHARDHLLRAASAGAGQYADTMTSTTQGELEDAARLDAPAPRRSRQGRLRRRRVQRQQHGTDPGDHGGRARDRRRRSSSRPAAALVRTRTTASCST